VKSWRTPRGCPWVIREDCASGRASVASVNETREGLRRYESGLPALEGRGLANTQDSEVFLRCRSRLAPGDREGGRERRIVRASRGLEDSGFRPGTTEQSLWWGDPRRSRGCDRGFRHLGTRRRSRGCDQGFRALGTRSILGGGQFTLPAFHRRGARIREDEGRARDEPGRPEGWRTGRAGRPSPGG
jgi:hypothetical protein